MPGMWQPQAHEAHVRPQHRGHVPLSGRRLLRLRIAERMWLSRDVRFAGELLLELKQTRPPRIFGEP
jgi:hypothetical protein